MSRVLNRGARRARIERMATTALLGSLALLLSYIETMIPLPLAVPGVKLGLANAAVLVALYALDVRSAASVALIKVLASGFLFGTPTMLAYSAGGTALALAAMVLCQRVLKLGVVPASMVSALCHNAGQLAVAAAMLGSTAVFLTLAPLAVAACVTGALIGCVAGGVVDALHMEQPSRRMVDLSSLGIEAGEHIAFVGPNGSGKTTAALQLAGLAEDGCNGVAYEGGKVGDALLTFQDPDDQLVNPIVQDDVAFGCENLGIELSEMRRLVAAVLADAGAGELAMRDVMRLSGGQKQQVAVAGVLAMTPRIVVFDEATAMQDAAGRARFAALIERLKGRGIAVVTVTQIPAEAALADRVAVFEDCRLVEVLSGAEYAQRIDSGRIGAGPSGPGIEGHLSGPVTLGGAGEVHAVETSSRERAGVHAPANRPFRLCHVERSETESSAVETSSREYAGVQVPAVQLKPWPDSSTPCAKPAPSARNDTAGERVGANAAVSGRALRLEGVGYRYPGAAQPVLSGVSLAILPGRIVGLAGPSGSGKSTLAQIAAGYLVPAAGLVALDGEGPASRDDSAAGMRDGRALTGLAPERGVGIEASRAPATPAQRRQTAQAFRAQVALVGQSPESALFAATAFEDVMFGARNRGLDEQEAASAAEEALRCVGIDPQVARQKSPFAFSGGEKRRIALAGMLVLDTPYLILDEPDAGLDPRELDRLQELLACLRAQGKGILLISHNEAFLEACCDELVELSGEGAVSDVSVTKPREARRWKLDVEVASKPQRSEQVFCNADLGAKREVASDLPTSRGLVTANAAETPAFGVYRPGNTLMHRLNPLAKLFACVLFMVAGFLASTWAALGLCAAFCAAALVASKTPPRDALRSLRPFAFLMAFVGVFDVLFVGSGDVWWQAGPVSLSSGGVLFAVQSVLRFAFVALGTSTLMRTTSATQLADACSLLLGPLSKLGLRVDDLALSLGMVLRFIPLLQEEFAAVKRAQEARLARFDTGGLVRRVKSLVPLVTPLFASCLRRSSALALAIENRGYGSSAKRTRFRSYPLRAADAVSVAAVALLFVVAIVL